MFWVKISPIMLAALLFSLFAKKHSPKAALFTWTYSAYFFITVAWAVLMTGIQYTPFAPIDHGLAHLDAVLGFSTPAVVNWVVAHSVIHHVLETAYNFLVLQMFVMPLVVALIMGRRAVNHLFLGMLITLLAGAFIYYFWPTMAPSGVFHHTHFTANQLATSQKFYQVHHHLPMTHFAFSCGMIAFPSFHVIWSVLFAMAFRGRKSVFYPLLTLNTIVIFSTFLLGWHYLIDAFAGVVIALAAVYAADKIIVWQKNNPVIRDMFLQRCKKRAKVSVPA
jgi:hypothetical protein